MIHRHLSPFSSSSKFWAFHLPAPVMSGCSLCTVIAPPYPLQYACMYHPYLNQCLQFCLHPLLLGDCQLQHHHLFTTTLVWGLILSAHPAATPLSSDIHAARRPKLPLPSWPSPTSHRSWLCWNWWLECCLILLGQLPLLPSEHRWAQLRLVCYLMCLLLLSRPHLNASLREFYKLCCITAPPNLNKADEREL